MNIIKEIAGKVILVLLSVLLFFAVAETVMRIAGDEPMAFKEKDQKWLDDHYHNPRNSKNLRDDEIPYEKPEGEFRVLVLGDSVTYGFGTLYGESYPQKLEEMLNAEKPLEGIKSYQVINSGMPGYCTRQEADFYRDEGRKYAPDLVLLGYFGNDPACGEKWEKKLRTRGIDYLTNPGLNLHNLPWIARRSMFIRFIITRAVIALSFENNISQFLKMHSPDFEDYGEWKKDLERIASMAREDKTPFVCVIWPIFVGMNKTPYRLMPIHDAVRSVYAPMNVEVLDLYGTFANMPEKRLWVTPTDPHPSPEAHETGTKVIYRFLEEKGLLKKDNQPG